MRNAAKKMKGKRVLSLLLAMIMAVSVFAPAVSALGTNTYKVELAFNNLFLFDDWADNDLSTTVMSALGPNVGGTMEIDVTNGSFRLTKTDMDLAEIFTAFSMDTEKASGNTPYYNMEVEPSTTYEFSYNVSGNIWAFTPYVFFYDNNGLYNSLVPYPTPAYGVNSFQFTTPENVTSIQIRWTIGDTSASRPDMSSVYADVSDIKIYKVESILAEENLFNFDTWASKSGSGGGTSVYGAGTHTAKNGKVTITSNGTASIAGCSAYLTNFTVAGAYDGNAYVVDTEPGKTYTLTYNLDSYTTQAPTNMQALIPWYNADKAWMSSYGMNESMPGKNSYTFTVPDGVYHFQIVFGLYDFEMTAGKTATVSNIELHESVVVKHTTNPHRKLYNYTYNGTNAQYGELPTPDYIPAGYVFSGWFTGLDGTGERITPETYVKMESTSVFAYYEPKVDTLELETAPNKTYTVGEKLDTKGLSLKATQSYTYDVTDENGNVTGTETGTRTFHINSNIYCTPEYLTTAGTQTITAHYGGKTVTFPVTVLAANSSDIVVNGEVMSGVQETNKKYTFLNASMDAFNRYKVTYTTDSYVRGIITFNNGAATEEFFLEPGDNKSFVSFVDDFLEDNTYTRIDSIEFTCLNNELGSFQLKEVSTEHQADIPEVAYYTNSKYEMGIDIRYGGVVSELYDLSGKNVTARTYNTTFDDGQGNTSNHTMTLVDYEIKLDEREDNFTVAGENQGALNATGEESTKVNLINTLDRGRYLQQSYYGTSEDPYVEGRFNDAPWKYNPVQGGNVAEEPSKVIDYEITDTYIYVKARPMEWEKWSDDHVDECEHWVSTVDGVVLAHTEKKYGNDVVSDTYVEAWYYFADGMIKVQNRKVDYSGFPDAYTQQEMPALYLIEPLNHFVYNEVAAGNEWSGEFDGLGGFNNGSLKNIEEPEFWGIVNSYNEYHYVTRDSEGKIISVVNDNNGDDFYDLSATCNENWAAFTASEDPDSFGVGVYSPGVTQMYYGVMPQIYASGYDRYGNIVANSDNMQYRHTTSVEPTVEMPTSYIAPLKEEWFRSYEATEYTYYLKTGTAEEIYDGFSTIGDNEVQEELEKTKIAVPETSYVNPANNTVGQFYVNNILNVDSLYSIETEAVSDNTNMYFGIHVKDGVSFSATVTNVTDPSNDIILGKGDGTGNREGEIIDFDTALTDAYISDGGFSLRLTNPLDFGGKATAKWDITVTMEDGTTKKHTVYTVLYATERTIGAVAEGRYDKSATTEIATWITGANGVDHSQLSPLGALSYDFHDSGWFREDPLVVKMPTIAGSFNTEDDYIYTTDANGIVGTGTEGTQSVDKTVNSYVMQTATNGSRGSGSQSYLGLLTVDKSRYTNTNQIPNFRLGYDVLRVGSAPKDSLESYTTYYTLGTNEAYTETDRSIAPSGWTVNSGTYTELAKDNAVPFRETVVPSYAVSTIDGRYIHALNQGSSVSTTVSTLKRWTITGSSVLCSVTDKSALRDAVLEGYTRVQGSVSEEEYEIFIEKLEVAATVLGDPSATQEEIDNARQELNENAIAPNYALKYDNLFSAYEYSLKSGSMSVVGDRGTVTYENGALTVVNGTITGGEAYTNYGSSDIYYLVDLKPNTEYVFEYDVTTDLKAQAFMFFYKADGSKGDVPANMSIKTNNGSWSAESESNPWFGNYTNTAGTYHYVIKFTTGANTAKASFRFGNTSNDPVTSTFSKIKLVEADKYYEEVTYAKTEDVFEENEYYGYLMTLEGRTGYTFAGWKDAAGNDVSEYTKANAHRTVYSQWTEHKYTIVYNANSGTGTVASQNTGYATPVALANGGFTKENYTLVGWSTDPNATNAQYGLGDTVSKLSAADGSQVTLYAVWAKVAYVSDDTVIIDFGLPVKISVLANDVVASNGSINGIGTGVQSNTVLNTDAYTSSRLTGAAATLTLGNGTAKIEGNKVVYTPASTNYEAEETFYYEFKTTDNKYYYAAVTVIPATSIYFEETMFTFTNSKVEVDGVEKEYKWQDVGTPVGERFQDEDRPGTFTIADADADNVYGTDSAYNDSTTYSMGSAKYITVDQNSNKANPLATASFTFTGTGFDLFTVTDTKAGLLTISIYQNGTKVKGYAVNTYYGYTYDETANDGAGGYVASTEEDAIFQVPVVRARGLAYGTYTAVVEPKYSYPFDVNYNKEYRVYVDSVRIFDPMGTENDTANDAYLADGEFAPDYLKLRDTIVTKDENGDYNVSTYQNSALFFDGFNPDMNDATDVIKNGPKNEVYLAKGQAVAFNISATSNLNIASVQLGMKLVNANGNAKVTVMNTQTQQPTEITLSSATEQFYKLDSAIVWDEAQLEQNKYVTAYPIVILNSTDNDVVISLTTLKWAFEDAGAAISTFSIIGDEQTLALAPAAIEWALTRVDPIDPENVAIDSPETVYLEDGKGKFTITTEAEIEKVTVNGAELTDCEINEDGKKVWTYSFDAEEKGENVFNVVVYDGEGNSSEIITNTITVVEEDSNDGGVDSGEIGEDIFANNLVKMIFDLIRRIFEFIGGAFA